MPIAKLLVLAAQDHHPQLRPTARLLWHPADLVGTNRAGWF